MHRHPFTPSPPRDPAVVPSLHIVIPLSSIPAPHASFKTESGRLHGQGKRRAVRPSEPDMSQPGKTGQKVVARVRFTAATRVDLSFNAADMRLLSMLARGSASRCVHHGFASFLYVRPHLQCGSAPCPLNCHSRGMPLGLANRTLESGSHRRSTSLPQVPDRKSPPGSRLARSLR
jgi:hypothetical protein